MAAVAFGSELRPGVGLAGIPAGRAARSLRRALVLGAAAFGAGLLAQVTTGLAGGGPLSAARGPGVARPAAERVWVVRPGDTLWAIAEAVSPPGSDVRPLVDRLASETGQRPLYPGERVALP